MDKNTYIVLDTVDEERKKDQVANGFGEEEGHFANQAWTEQEKSCKTEMFAGKFIALYCTRIQMFLESAALGANLNVLNCIDVFGGAFSVST